MTYTLTLQLAGADKIEGSTASILKNINALKGGSIAGILGGSNSPTAKVLSDLDKASHRVAGMKKDFQSISTSFAQGMNATGKAWMTAAFSSKSASFQALNPQMAEIMRGLQPQLPWKSYDMATRLKTGLMQWALPAVAFPALGHAGTIKGLRDVTGMDLAKVLAMGAFNPTGNTIKGLRDVTGADLAKVAALGTFGAWDKPPILKPPKEGGGGGALLMLAGRAVPEITAALAALDLFNKAVKSASAAINKGYGVYTQSAASGVTPGLFSYRSALADIFGVQGNPNQVFMFGKAVKEVSDRIADSTRIIAAASPTMAQIGMNAKILKLDFDALATEVTTKFAPVINLVMAQLDNLIKLFDTWAQSKFFKLLINSGTAVAAEALPFLSASKGFAQFNKSLPQMLPLLMKQLPGSQWESMGLSIGPNIGNEMVNQLRKSNSYLKHLPMIATALGANNGVPRGNQFGLAPFVNNP